MTSQPGLQRIIIHIFLNISKIEGKQIVKFGQLIECNKQKVFFKNHAEYEAGRLLQDLFLFFKKALYKVKISGLLTGFTIFR